MTFGASIQAKLTLIKILHTAIWVFFNVVIFYMLYAAIANKLNLWLWMGYGFVFLEGLTLLTFKNHCPLNLLARKYTNSTKANFDIYLSLTDAATTASLVFQFNAEGAIATMRADARYRDKLTAMPWGGRFWNYSVRDGMLIPLEGEVGWEHTEGIRLYFKGRITEISYEFAQ